jgi:hypothetical protein
MDAEREREHAGLGERKIYAAKVVKKTPRQSGENIKQITIEAYSEREITKNHANAQPFRPNS